MSAKSESKRLWRTALLVAAVGVAVLVPLAWLAVRMYNDTIQQKVMSANEASALAALENIQAQEQSFLETEGRYATFPQLAEAGVIQAPLSGDALVSDGYRFTLKVTPKTDAQGPTYSVNADPVRGGGRDATGRRHFFISSEVSGVRYNEERPATAADKPRQNVQEY
ncbi:MAG: hypothetical protein DMF67_17935 [Acidobacteria bacterium]|nr:MAG: hypothetical protein DMF66_12425 [Acidobacteriota bacterium]PYS81121.1 MAG: hypothetical protein DMF67_17935 [Acidobacteriota bacterium]